ncbi:MAG: hypothetical protein JSV53_03815 [candidate division WOR-3 bacterium]|nr:MAG: hypothetical protein JSV53_03815 [candidate division WOR-3 bacterium]
MVKSKFGNRRAVARWEIGGFFFINLLGSLLHFVFDWFGRWRPLALIAAVNESTWEHLKLAFWPALLFMLIEHKYLGKQTRNFLFGKVLSFYVMPAVIILLFYGYLWIVGQDVLVLDILIFVFAVGVGQLVSFMILSAEQEISFPRKVSMILLAILTLAFLAFTFLPPRMLFFKDPVTGGYGIID